jgi:hypothetical protein
MSEAVLEWYGRASGFEDPFETEGIVRIVHGSCYRDGEGNRHILLALLNVSGFALNSVLSLIRS